jgi:hypothetical protein
MWQAMLFALVVRFSVRPGLRERLCVERQLADDARQRCSDREIDRHERIAGRISGLLAELGEPGRADDER